MRLVIIVYVYYLELWAELARCIRNFEGLDYDLFITFPTCKKDVPNVVQTDFPNVTLISLDNKGYDIGPFFHVLNRLNLDAYDIVVKLHTKRNIHGWVNHIFYFGGGWRRRLLNFCYSRKSVERSLKAFKFSEDLGMLAHPALIVGRGESKESNALITAAEMITARLLGGSGCSRRRFVAGSMFMARATVFVPLWKKVSIDEFQESPGGGMYNGHCAGLANVYERVLGYIVEEQGYHVGSRLTAIYEIFVEVRALVVFLMKPVMSLIRPFYRCCRTKDMRNLERYV